MTPTTRAIPSAEPSRPASLAKSASSPPAARRSEPSRQVERRAAGYRVRRRARRASTGYRDRAGDDARQTPDRAIRSRRGRRTAARRAAAASRPRRSVWRHERQPSHRFTTPPEQVKSEQHEEQQIQIDLHTLQVFLAQPRRHHQRNERRRGRKWLRRFAGETRQQPACAPQCREAPELPNEERADPRNAGDLRQDDCDEDEERRPGVEAQRGIGVTMLQHDLADAQVVVEHGQVDSDETAPDLPCRQQHEERRDGAAASLAHAITNVKRLWASRSAVSTAAGVSPRAKMNPGYRDPSGNGISRSPGCAVICTSSTSGTRFASATPRASRNVPAPGIGIIMTPAARRSRWSEGMAIPRAWRRMISSSEIPLSPNRSTAEQRPPIGRAASSISHGPFSL